MYNNYSHFTGEKIEVHRGHAIVPKLDSWEVATQAWKRVSPTPEPIPTIVTLLYIDSSCLQEGESFHSRQAEGDWCVFILTQISGIARSYWIN